MARAERFCDRCTLECNAMVRLPTEAEWEYAARAGMLNFASDEVSVRSLAWYSCNSAAQTHPVGQKPANPWGLFDLFGHVAEWCSDWYGRYDDQPQVDPTGVPRGTMKVVRGGSWYSALDDCRATRRDSSPVGDRNGGVGFRVLRMAGE